MANRSAESAPSSGRATIVDVARESNVSYSTVADILRAKSRFSYRPETIQRVREAAQRCGYETHTGARLMRQQKSTLIGIVVPVYQRNHISALSLAVHEEILAHGYQSVVIGSQVFDAPVELDGEVQTTAKSFPDLQSLAGVVLLDFTVELGVPESFTRLMKSLPYVATYAVTSPEINLASYDMGLAVEKVVEYLVGLGHRRIAFADRFMPKYPSNDEKVKGWRRGVQRFAASLDGAHDISLAMCHQNDRLNMGIQIAEQLQALEQKPTALICPSDDVALSTMGQLMHRGWKIPQDISITGIDDIEFAAFTCPTLTTVRQPSEEMGRAAVELLLSLIKRSEASETAQPVMGEPETGEEVKAQQLFIEPQLIIRESTAPPALRTL